MVELVLQSGSLSLQDSNGEFADALMLVMGSQKVLERGSPICLRSSFSQQLFDIFFSTGIASEDSRVNPVTVNFSSRRALVVDLPTFPLAPMTKTLLMEAMVEEEL